MSVLAMVFLESDLDSLRVSESPCASTDETVPAALKHVVALCLRFRLDPEVLQRTRRAAEREANHVVELRGSADAVALS